MLKKSTAAQRRQMMDFIVSVEARRNKRGELAVYRLPPADGGGTYEVAGINDRFHPQMAAKLKMLIRNNYFERAEAEIRTYLLAYTNIVTRWTTHPAIEAFLRDAAFNRGPKGALRILQIALQVADDGKWGPLTRAAYTVAIRTPQHLLTNLRIAREAYERRVAPPVGKRAAFWHGLVNRWDKAHTFAQSFL